MGGAGSCSLNCRPTVLELHLHRKLGENQIGMGLQSLKQRMSHTLQVNAHSLTSSEFHSGHEIRIPSCKHEDVSDMSKGYERDVETNTHIHTFLMKVRY
jgi:hypothetical protein